jgi:hypothetical protein
MTTRDDVSEILRSKPVVDPPSPWRRVQTSIEGVAAVGFAPESAFSLCCPTTESPCSIQAEERNLPVRITLNPTMTP